MFQLQELTLACSRNSRSAGGGDGVVAFGVSPRNTEGWSGLKLPLTSSQGEFGEDLSEEGKRTKSSGTG
jgi:hypothetical protein